jgi:phosphate starvation-inducible PhoH-like protein
LDVEQNLRGRFFRDDARETTDHAAIICSTDNPRTFNEPNEDHVIVRRAFSPPDNERLAHVCGALDENLRAIEQGLNVVITRRQEHFRVEGGKLQAPRALALIEALYERSGRPIDEEQLQLMLYEAQRDVIQGHAKPVAPAEVAAGGEIVLHTRRANLIGRTPNQVQYLRQILSHDITLGLGPAGTGKTFLAVACAVDALERASVQRIVLTRPAVEAGERLGFLPGDLSQKVDPYLRPLYDALHDLMGYERVTKAFERGAIEIAPLAFMRGRTLNHAFVILDEAQNATPEQMKMFLTRIGFGTKAVVTGDLTQVDLPRGARSGLADASDVLRDVTGIAVTQFGAADVVRHPLVARIVEAYEAAGIRDEAAAQAERAERAPVAPANFQEGRRSTRGGRS